MPSGTHHIELTLPIKVIWEFVKDMDNWAPLVPNYIQHEKVNESQSTWEFKNDLGIIKTKMSLLIDIIEWKEPTRVSFTLKSKSERFTGSGFFEAKALNVNKTKLTGFLEVTANGKMGPTMNSKLETSLPEYVEEMGVSIAKKLEELYGKIKR
ncbi:MULTISPECIES: SRPBCC family protein [Bacillaceae]|uniref:SRPBCC family protein n=1 Tax=Bacillaceae TaxID=186817 RepID=UPI003000CF61